MSNAQMQALALKITQVVMLLVGVAFTTYNVFSFKVGTKGYYFQDTNQTWLAVGVTAIAIAYVIKNWNKM